MGTVQLLCVITHQHYKTNSSTIWRVHMNATISNVTSLLADIKNGSKNAYNQLLPLVYYELKRLAHCKINKEYNDITLSSTSLVHEVYLKMVDQTVIKANDKNHLLAISARCMRQILVDRAREKSAQKRGGDQTDLTYVDELLNQQQKTEELINIDQKLDELEKLNKRLTDVVTMRFFGKMSIRATADALDISSSTVKRDWAKARGWLYKELKKEEVYV